MDFKRDTSAMARIQRSRKYRPLVATELELEEEGGASQAPPTRRKRACGDFPAVPNNCFIVPKELKTHLRDKLDQISWWFTQDRLRDIVTPLIQRTRPAIDSPGEKLSIRLLSWGLINYSKAHSELCDYMWTNPETGETIQLNILQVQDLIAATNSRDSFAPHRRSRLIHIKVDDKIINTAFEQLNFFFLMGYYGAIEWTIDHKEEIRAHMDICMERAKRMKADAAECGVQFKRRALCNQGTTSGTACQLPHDETKASALHRLMQQMKSGVKIAMQDDTETDSDGASEDE